ncbi:MAG: hypothetical protein IJL22_02430 [Bacteroidales bacterium]|nr:hypothetical protein [Bacteroidales bacterium]
MKNFLRITTLLLLLLAGSCDVHELPEGEDYVLMTFRLHYDEEMPPYQDLTFESKASAQALQLTPSYALRTVLGLYESQPGGTWSHTPFWKTEVIDDNYSSLDRDVSVLLPPKRFRAFIWTDYVRTDGGDNYFFIEDFPEVRQAPGQSAGGDFMASYYAVDFAPMDEVTSLDASVERIVEMTRPSAKICFYASDIEDYLTELRKRAASVNGYPDAITPLSINLDSYTMKVTYLGFLPDAWNVREGLSSDSNTGHSFLGHASLIDNGSVYFGCDYVFSGEESSIDVMLEVFDPAGVLITRLNKITIPISKGKTTTVTGRMMTHGISGSVVIDPEYDGEFNIYI